jgi:hypothetical protein
MKKAVSIFMAFLMLTSSAGITLATHLCGGVPVITEFMLGHAALDCGMMDTAEPCTKNHSQTTLQKQPCCENQYNTLETSELVGSGSLTLPSAEFLAAFTISWFRLTAPEFNINQSFNHYSPPLLEFDLPVFFQVFRL